MATIVKSVEWWPSGLRPEDAVRAMFRSLVVHDARPGWLDDRGCTFDLVVPREAVDEIGGRAGLCRMFSTVAVELIASHGAPPIMARPRLATGPGPFRLELRWWPTSEEPAVVTVDPRWPGYARVADEVWLHVESIVDGSAGQRPLAGSQADCDAGVVRLERLGNHTWERTGDRITSLGWLSAEVALEVFEERRHRAAVESALAGARPPAHTADRPSAPGAGIVSRAARR